MRFSFFFPRKPKLDTIISSINTQVTQLEELVKVNNNRVDDNNAEIQALQVENTTLTGESGRAIRIADRLTDLVK